MKLSGKHSQHFTQALYHAKGHGSGICVSYPFHGRLSSLFSRFPIPAQARCDRPKAGLRYMGTASGKRLHKALHMMRWQQTGHSRPTWIRSRYSQNILPRLEFGGRINGRHRLGELHFCPIRCFYFVLWALDLYNMKRGVDKRSTPWQEPGNFPASHPQCKVSRGTTNSTAR